MPRKPKTQKPEEMTLVEAPVLTEPSFDGSLDGLARMLALDGESLEQTRERTVEILRGEDDCAKFVGAYDRLSRKGSPSLDSVALKSGMSRSATLGALVRVLHQWNFDVAKLVVTSVLAKNSGALAQAVADRGRALEDGYQDSRLAFEALRVIERKGGGTINVNAQANNSSTSVRAEQAVVNVERELPAFEDGTRRMAAKLRELPPANPDGGGRDRE